ncbi:hypothetical protein FHX52_0608 [Humibacillus xanthopallidus]|uniref:DUF7144 domain-containing protein n=1 Tax=Humibacillus xanthopallidus TaxID=412689 RepID=A0A543PTY0_9MICO|nr:hypothetical protein [Humibacillus xanthopallidus]TQN47506.1 hypothetical protein FHX52_0608 [Humibacillus xanthopallidus]
MTDSTSRRSGKPATGTAWAVGASTFAACLMLMVGIFQAVEGLAAIVNGTDFLIKGPTYVFTFNASTWGWIHLILGVIIAVAGAAILTGNIVARSVGIGLAVLSAIANFLWLPYYPIWALVIIALNVFIIWGLAKADLGRD